MKQDPTIIILGASGMLGEYMTAFFKEKQYDVFVPTRFDARKVSEHFLSELLAPYADGTGVVINCLGLIKQRKAPDEDFKTINALFPRLLSSVSNKKNIPLIHISTDCVFDGTRGKYTEKDIPDSTDIYGQSKAAGEPENATVIRTSIIGSEKRNRLSLIEWVKSKAGQSCDGYANHLWNGTTTLELAKICEKIISEKKYWEGIHHFFSPRDVSKYELVQNISDAYDLNISVQKTNAPISCDRTLRSIHSFISPPDITLQINELATWDRVHFS
jgi:dTDP-4-dehydrorhamnose reductase